MRFMLPNFQIKKWEEKKDETNKVEASLPWQDFLSASR